jgi:selenide,water dikinase
LTAQAGAVALRLDPAALPVLDGALPLLESGLASTLAPENRRARRALADDGGWGGTARWELLFDPQTAGGLLAAVPSASAQACLAALDALGETASLIGTVASARDAARPLSLAPRTQPTESPPWI